MRLVQRKVFFKYVCFYYKFPRNYCLCKSKRMIHLRTGGKQKKKKKFYGPIILGLFQKSQRSYCKRIVDLDFSLLEPVGLGLLWRKVVQLHKLLNVTLVSLRVLTPSNACIAQQQFDRGSQRVLINTYVE